MTASVRLGALLGVAAIVFAGCGSEADAIGRGGASSGATTDGGAGSSFGTSDAGEAAKTCAADSDCNDGDACTHDYCVWSGEFASCENLASEGPCNATPVPPGFIDPIDPACSGGSPTSPEEPEGPEGPKGPGKQGGGGGGWGSSSKVGGGGVLFPPFVPLKPDDVPADCSNGFELQQAEPNSVYLLTTKTAQGSRAITLDVDFATYTAPDGMTITAIDANGVRQVLLDTCRMRTWISPDPTGGQHRPPDVTIRQFRINLPAGSAELEIKFGQVVSPMYLRLVGLCDFDVTPFASARRWAPVP